MKRLGIAVALATIALAGALALAAVGFAEGPKISASAFHDGMRKLWEDHVTWTRLVIVDVAFGTPDTQATLERLLQNQVDIGNAIKPFYGDAAGSQLTGDYGTSISTYEQVHLEILQMADMLSAGIIAQFPSMFAGSHAM